MSAVTSSLDQPLTLTPGITISDPHCAYRIAQAIWRLRREICWCWHQRVGQPGDETLPPLTDPAVENLNLARYDETKQRFFSVEATAVYLSERISTPPPAPARVPKPGSWDWVAQTLALDDAAQFVLALALATRLDASLAPVIAACANDTSRPFATLSLAQRLWDDPLAIVGCADPANPLFRYGLVNLGHDGAPGMEWWQPLEVHPFVANALLSEKAPRPQWLDHVDDEPSDGGADPTYVARLAGQALATMQLVPLLGTGGVNYAGAAAELARAHERPLVRFVDRPNTSARTLRAVATLCWLHQWDVLLPEDWPETGAHNHDVDWTATLRGIPVRWYLPVMNLAACKALPASVTLPPYSVASVDFNQRRRFITEALGERTIGLTDAIAECARQFRFQQAALRRVVDTLNAQPGNLSTKKLFAAFRTEASADMGYLAEPLVPRFKLDEVILPARERRQLDEVVTAMNALTTVHYEWGTARVWNDGGLAVLFCGPPGTGKTMAAEALSSALAAPIPMYRVDLSQVVNKYIGETEKNLKRIFDAAETSDCILFFDEADALFGKRTEVKDAHDRFANIEISYLLERMERFKGLAILATNRRKDLDDAFLRRLRYVIEFPLPDVPERERIWRQMFPTKVDTSTIDFGFLAKQFPLCGGHIRSIAFNACLQAALATDSRRITMEHVVVAVKRELDKLNRGANEDTFGEYAKIVRELVA